jgi:hypothetical protein
MKLRTYGNRVQVALKKLRAQDPDNADIVWNALFDWSNALQYCIGAAEVPMAIEDDLNERSIDFLRDLQERLRFLTEDMRTALTPPDKGGSSCKNETSS